MKFPVARISTDTCNLSLVARNAGVRLTRHWHASTNIALGIRGTFTETVGEQRVVVDRATFIARPAGVEHENWFDHGDATYLLIELTDAGTALLRAHCHILSQPFAARAHCVAPAANRAVRELLSPDSTSALVVDSLVLGLCAEIDRGTKRTTASPAWMRQILAVIQDDPCNATLGLTSLAKQVDVHPSHVAREFRRLHQMSLGEYVRRARLERAFERVLHSADPLSVIATESGFVDQSHFTRVFAATYGTSPGRYRKSGPFRRSS